MPYIARREFVGSVVLAALAPMLGVGAMPLEGAWWEPAVHAAGEDLDALASALANVVRVQYGDRLTEADLTSVARQIRSGLERAESMRKVELANGDEPDFVFSADSSSHR